MELSRLSPAKGSRKVRRRVGRGEGSGAGKTSGRGGKGQTARSGGSIRPGFEGGQMPLYRRLPKIGFTSTAKIKGKNIYREVKLGSLEIFNAGDTVDTEALLSKGLIKNIGRTAGIKVLSSPGLTKKLAVKVQAITASAKAEIEKLGGTVEIVERK